MLSPRSTLRRAAFALVLCTGAALSPARADDYVDRANAAYKAVPQAKRSDLILLPLIAKMDKPPVALETLEEAYKSMVVDPAGPKWAPILAWINGAPQRALLDALKTVAADENPQTHMVFAQPYGVENVSPELVQAGLYTELGDPPLLAAAKPLYLDKLEPVFALVQFEATRLVSEGKANEAVELLMRDLGFAHQLADRTLVDEKGVGCLWMGMTMQRLRDVVYSDFRATTHSITPDMMKEVVKRLNERTGITGIERLTLPGGELLAAEQLANRVYLPTGKPNPAVFGSTMAGISSSGHPLRLFSEAARWNRAAGSQEDLKRIIEVGRGVFADWDRRWKLPPHDPFLGSNSEFQRSIAGNRGFGVLERFRGVDILFQLRNSLRTEAAGTRTALAMYGFWLREKQFPLRISAVRPAFVDHIDADPYASAKTELLYFVPMRDQPAGPDGQKSPHSIKVFPGGRLGNFESKLGDDTFVLYSVGPDDDKGWCREATQINPDLKGDYLLWPPVISLYRQYLKDQGRLN